MRRYFLLIAASILTLACTNKKEQLQGEWISSYVNFMDSVRYPFETSEILTFKGDSLTWTRTGSSLLGDESKQTFAFKADKDLVLLDTSSQFELGLNIISPDCFTLLPEDRNSKTLFYRRLKTNKNISQLKPAGKSYVFEAANNRIFLNFFESGLLTSSFIKKGEDPVWDKGVWRTRRENNRILLITEAPFPYTFVLDSISDSGAYFTNYDETIRQLHFKELQPQTPVGLMGLWRNTDFKREDNPPYFSTFQDRSHIQTIEFSKDSITIKSAVFPSKNSFRIVGESNFIVEHLKKDSADIVNKGIWPKNRFNVLRKTNRIWFIHAIDSSKLVLKFNSDGFLDQQTLTFERMP